MTDKKRFGDESPDSNLELLKVLQADDDQTQTLDLASIFTQDLSSSGSFLIKQDIWATTFGKLLQALPIPVFLIDESKAIVAVNQACARISPTYERALGSQFPQLVPQPVQAKACLSVLEEVFTSRKPKMLEVTLRIDEGTIWGRISFRSVRVFDSRFVLALAEDLTAEKRRLVLERESRTAILKVNEELKVALEEKERLLKSREALLGLLNTEKTRAEDLYRALKEQMERRERADRAIRESESRYRQIVEGAHDIIFRTDAAGFFSYVNAVAVRVSGYSEKELIGKRFAELVEPAHKAGTERFYGIQFVKRTPNTYHEYPFVSKSGEVIWLGQQVQLLFDGEQVSGFQAIARDITDRKRAEEALRKSEERLDLALRGADLGLWDFNIQTGEAFYSARQVEMIGYTPEEPEPQYTWMGKLIHPDDLNRVRKAFNDHAKGRTPIYECELRLRHKSGEYRWVLSRGKVLEWDTQGNPSRVVGTSLDITDRKRVEEALRVSERRLDLALKGADLGMWDYNFQTGEAFVSARRAEMVGYTLEEVEPHFTWWGKQVHPEDLDRVRQAMSDHARGRTPMYECEHRVRHKSGEYTWVLSRGKLVEWDDKGNPARAVGTTMDITDRKRIEEALKESEARFREFAEAVPQLVYEVDARGNIVFVNRAGLALGGYKPEDARSGLSMTRFLPQEDLPKLVENMRQVLSGESTSGTEYTLLAKDGTRIPIAAYSTPVIKRGKVAGVRGVCVDITKHKEAEAILRRSRDEMEKLVAERTSELQVVNDELAALNGLGGEIAVTLSLEEMVHRALSAVVSVANSDCAKLMLFKDNVLALKGYVFEGHAVAGAAFPVHQIGECLCGLAVQERKPVFSTNIHDDPRCTWDECKQAGLRAVAAIPLLDGDATVGCLALASFQSRDFSSRAAFLESLGQTVAMGLKNALLFEEVEKHVMELADRLAELNRSNEEREALQKQLWQAQKMEAIGRLAGGVAHDFNNLLTVIGGYADNLIRQSFPGSPQQEKLLEMRRASDRAASLTRQLLAFGRKQVLEVRVLDLNDVIKNLGSMVSRLMPENVNVSTVLTASPASVKAADNQIGQVLINLIVNARDAMPQGGKLTIETSNAFLDKTYSLTHPEVEPGCYILLAVSDNGTGMDAETQARAFDPFFTTKEKGVGTGLGLSTVFGIAKQHGGHVSVYSEPGLGSTFKVYFPQAQEPEHETLQESIPAVVYRGGETVLVVEDDESVRNFTCSALEELGYSVLKASDPVEATAICEQYQDEIDLMLTDVVLPQMDGRSLYERLVLQRPRMNVLYMSGYTDDAIVNHGVLEEGVHFLQKPFSTNALATKIGAVFGGLGPQPANGTPLEATTDAEMGEEAMRERLSALPQELTAGLRRAAEEASRSKTSHILERIRERDAGLAAALTGLVRRFRFDRIIELTRQSEGAT
jgi:PAS domain S-box-containing protein